MKLTLTVLLSYLTLLIFAQDPVSQYATTEVFGNRGEIYFRLEGAAPDAEKLTRIISIDKIENNDIYAYASVKEFEKLKQSYSYPFYNLPKPSELVQAAMSSSSREVLDWNYYPTFEAYLQIMQDFATNYPSLCKLDTIGYSTLGRIIIAARISDNVGIEEDEPEFLYTSSIHGDETTGYVLMLHLMDYLLSNYGTIDKVTNLVNSIDIWINPLANPDGTYAGGNSSVNGATRYNANYIDLNRNYADPDDGPHPDWNDWQAETIAFMQFAEERDFVMSANFHGGAEVINYPWDTWSKLTADDAWWRMISRQYVDTVHKYSPSGYMTDLENGITNGYAWYTITGGRQDYMNYFDQCREVTIEISNTKLLPASQLINHWNYNYPSLINYMQESLFGLRGIVTDTITGEPLEAQIFISGFDKDSSMVFSSFPIGNYHRLLKAGTYNVTFACEGYVPKTYKNIQILDKSTKFLNAKLWDGSAIPAFTASDTLIAPGNPVTFHDVSGGSPNSRYWTFEGGTPSNSTEVNPVVTYAAEGEYDVSLQVGNVIGSNTKTVTDFITVRKGVRVQELLVQNTNLYPNPVTNGKLTITSQRVFDEYTITDLTGKVLLEGAFAAKEKQLNVSQLAKGVYLLKLTVKGESSLMKFLVL